MAWKYPVSKNSASWPAIDLGATDSVYIGVGVFVSTDAIGGSTIYGTGTGQQVIIDGSIAGSNAIDLRSGYYANVGDFVRVSDGAKIFADTRAMILQGFNYRIENDGAIESLGDGIDIEGYSTTVGSKIVNSGTISARAYAIEAYNGTQSIDLNNSGTITGTYLSFRGGAGKDTIVNSGLMRGLAFLGDGEDFYDGRKGRILISDQPGYSGSVDGGGGNDKIYGGAAREEFDGGTGFDRISGGKGGDILTGGADGDTFVYNTLKDSTVKPAGRDTITDFEHQLDRIDLSHLHPNTKNDEFRFVGDGALKRAGDLHFILHDAAGTKNDYTIVEGTVDANSRADFQIKLTGLITLSANDFIL